MATNLDALLHLTQALESAAPAARLRLDLVTRNAQPAGNDPATDGRGAGAEHRIDARDFERTFQSLAGAPSIFPRNFPGRCGIDLERAISQRRRSAKSPCEVKLVMCDDWIAAARLASSGSIRFCRCVWNPASAAVSTRSASTPFELPPCGPGQVLIEVKAAGMNFRDVLKALALYPGDAPDARIFGDEVGGIVKEVGSGVTHIAPGDRVFGLAVFGIATHAIARAGDVRRIPADLTFEAAATLPVVFMTAWHALRNVARLRKGERVLVHAGAGGVGMAAIQIALHLGAEVIASAGSPSKRALAQNARSETRDRLATRRFCRGGA